MLASGGARHPGDVFQDFRGRPPSSDALLKSYGLKWQAVTLSVTPGSRRQNMSRGRRVRGQAATTSGWDANLFVEVYSFYLKPSKGDLRLQALERKLFVIFPSFVQYSRTLRDHSTWGVMERRRRCHPHTVITIKMDSYGCVYSWLWGPAPVSGRLAEVFRYNTGRTFDLESYFLR